MKARKMNFGMMLLVAFVMTSMNIMAGPVSKEEALQKAAAFMAGKGKDMSGMTLARTAPRKAAPSKADAASAAYYIFNANEGFVVISGDDRTPEVLGYSDSGTFSEENMPINMKAWLNTYADQIAALDSMAAEGVIVETTEESTSLAAVYDDFAAIAPMLKTNWNQDAPYNNMCPTYSNPVTGKEVHCVTGCGATALAQILYYHRYPNYTSSVIAAYTSQGSYDSYGNPLTYNMAALPVTTFKWDDMITGIGDYTTENDAVAKLMKYVGYAIKSDYGASTASSSGNIVYGVVKYFGYSADAYCAYRDVYTNDQWHNMVYNELAEARPVLYCGQSSGGGHAFVCDGYSEDGLYHINWGWGGHGNGYFRLDVLNPYTSGIGGSYTSGGFSMLQECLIGLQPTTGAETKTGYYLTNLGISFDGTDITPMFMNNTSQIADFDLGLNVKNTATSENTTYMLTTWEDAQCGYGGGVTIDFAQLTLTQGTYEIRLLSKMSAATTWGRANGKDYYLIVTVDVNGNMTLSYPSTMSAPNVEVTKVDIPAELVRGEIYSIDVTIKNKSANDFNANVYMLFYKNEDTLEEILNGTGTVAFKEVEGCYINGNETGVVTLSPAMVYAGEYYYAIVADYGDTMSALYTGKVNILTETDIENIPAYSEDGDDAEAYYTLQGLRINKPTAPGLYIHNGKKVLVK